VKPGVVILVHDDTPRINWQLAVVEDTISEDNSLIRAANIRTSTGRTNCPITKLYPREVIPYLNRAAHLTATNRQQCQQLLNGETARSEGKKTYLPSCSQGKTTGSRVNLSTMWPPEDIKN